MDCVLKDSLLQFNPDTLEYMRKLYDLDNSVRLNEAINILDDWIKKQNHFTRKDFDRAYLERAIIISKGSVERAKSLLDSMCTYRTLLPKYFSTPPNLKDYTEPLFKFCWVVPMPKMTKDHLRVVVIKVTKSDITPNDYHTFCVWAFMIFEYLKRHDYLHGIFVILDYRTLNFPEFLSRMGITEMREFINITIKGFGARLKAIHIISDSKILDLILPIVKQLISPKIISRIKLHHDVESVHEYVDPSILPSEIGGSERSLDTLSREWVDLLNTEENMEYLKSMNESRTDETQRLEQNFNSLYMGTPGSFRNLIVD